MIEDPPPLSSPIRVISVVVGQWGSYTINDPRLADAVLQRVF